MTTRVEVMRVNANDDQLQLIEVHVAEGDRVEEGQVLFVLETTKSAVEVPAPAAGHVRRLSSSVGDFVGVGDLLCEIAETEAILEHAAPPLAGSATLEVVVTAKARKIAAERGIAIEQIPPVNGRIGEAEVLAALSVRTGGIPHPGRAAGPLPWNSAWARRAIVVGGGGHAACVIDALEGAGYDIVGCTDQLLPIGQPVYRGISVVGREDDLVRYRADGVDFAFIGVGGADSSTTRRKLFEKAAVLGFVLPAVIHPHASVAGGTTLGAGCQVFAGASIGPRCAIGRNVIVNQGSIVCHDTRVDDHAHLTPGAILAGGVGIGAMSVVGMGATVLFQVAIGENCLIHNGAQVNTAVADNTILDARGIRSRR